MIELIILAILLCGAWRGWRNGLIKEVVSFAGIFLGFYVAYELYRRAQVDWLGSILIWIAVPLALNVVAWALTSLLDHTEVIGTVNKLLGAAVGFLKFAFLLGCVIMAVDYVTDVKHRLEKSPTVKALETIPNVIFPEVNKEVDNGGKQG